jgi:hypothetical protein
VDKDANDKIQRKRDKSIYLETTKGHEIKEVLHRRGDWMVMKDCVDKSIVINYLVKSSSIT